MFEIEKNKEDLNLTAGRSVACVDRKGNGKYGYTYQIMVDQRGFMRLKIKRLRINQLA